MESNSEDNNSHDSKLLNCMLLHRPSVLLLHLKDLVEHNSVAGVKLPEKTLYPIPIMVLGKELNSHVWILMFSQEKKKFGL